jgi:hypothetical protein
LNFHRARVRRNHGRLRSNGFIERAQNTLADFTVQSQRASDKALTFINTWFGSSQPPGKYVMENISQFQTLNSSYCAIEALAERWERRTRHQRASLESKEIG